MEKVSRLADPRQESHVHTSLLSVPFVFIFVQFLGQVDQNNRFKIGAPGSISRVYLPILLGSVKKSSSVGQISLMFIAKN